MAPCKEGLAYAGTGPGPGRPVSKVTSNVGSGRRAVGEGLGNHSLSLSLSPANTMPQMLCHQMLVPASHSEPVSQ